MEISAALFTQYSICYEKILISFQLFITSAFKWVIILHVLLCMFIMDIQWSKSSLVTTYFPSHLQRYHITHRLMNEWWHMYNRGVKHRRYLYLYLFSALNILISMGYFCFQLIPVICKGSQKWTLTTFFIQYM